jgi:phage head maturation protease
VAGVFSALRDNEMIYLAAPYNRQSGPIEREGSLLTEIISPGCFGESLAQRARVKLLRGHGGGLICKVRPYEDERGLWFEWDGDLPEDFNGFSVRFNPERWSRVGPGCFRLNKARLRHIALLSSDDIPAYPQTKTAGLTPAVIER